MSWLRALSGCAFSLGLGAIGCMQPSRNIGRPVAPGERKMTAGFGQTFAKARHDNDRTAPDRRRTSISEGFGLPFPSLGYRGGLTPSIDLGFVAGLTHVGGNTRMLLAGNRDSSSLVLTADLRFAAFFAALANRDAYDVTSHLLWFTPLTASGRASLVLGVGGAAGKFMHTATFPTYGEWGERDGYSYAALSLHEARAQGVLGVSFWQLDGNNEHVFYLQPTFILAQEEDVKYGYVPRHGAVLAYSGTYSSRL